MKTLSSLAILVALAASPALAHDDDAPAHKPAAASTAPAAKTGEGVGVVKSVDAKAGSVTLHHGPVAALGWPAMTMTFKADPALLQGLKSGQKVTFTVADGDAPQITAIHAQ